jgi:hypothetical protein
VTNPDRHELWQLLDAIQMDLRAATAKLVAVRAHISQLDLPQPTAATCPHCQLRLAGPNTLAEHLHVSHNGPIPDHWLLADQRAADPHPDA